MRLSRCLLWGVVPVLIFCAIARAAEPLPRALLTSNAPNAEDRKLIAGFINTEVQKMGKEDATDEGVIVARSKLVDYFQKGGSKQFHLVYSEELAKALLNLINSPKPGVRLNALILVCKLTDVPGGVTLTIIGLGDPNAGVRYWAGKAAVELTKLDTDWRAIDRKKQELVDALEKAILKDTSSFAVREHMVALAGVPGAEKRLLDLMVERLSNPSADGSVLAELDSMSVSFPKMVAAAEVGQDPPKPEVVRQLAAVSARLMKMAAAALDRGTVPNSQQSQYVELIKVCDKILPWAVKRLNKDVTPLGTSDPMVALRDWAKVSLRAEEWRRLLINELKLSEKDLKELEVPSGRGAGEPTTAPAGRK